MSNEMTLAQKIALIETNLSNAEGSILSAMAVVTGMKEDLKTLCDIAAMLGSVKAKPVVPANGVSPEAPKRTRRSKEQIEADKLAGIKA